VLIDTVDHKFSREFVQNLRSEIDLDASTTSSSTTRKKTTPVR
jgi:hypothetical protein